MSFSLGIVEVLHFMLGVQHHGDHLVPSKPQEDPEMIALSRFDLRSLDVRCVVHGVPVIILKHAQHVFEFRSGNEHHARPVMNHSAGARDGLVVVEDFQLLHLYFAAFQRSVGLRALFVGELIDPQQVRTALQLGFISRFRAFYVAFKRHLRLCFQFWGRRFTGLRHGRRHLMQGQCGQQKYGGACGDVVYGLHLSREPFRLHHADTLNTFI